MNRFLQKLIALIALSCGSALAQTQVFYADDLARAPSGIAVSPGYLTILEFYQEVDQVASGRPGMMKVEVNGAKIYVSALVQSGSTDLVVEVGSRTQLFRVSVMKGNAPRRYVIVLQKPVPRVTAPQTVTPAPAAPPLPATKPVATRPVTPRPAASPQSTSTVASGSVVGLNDPSARIAVQSQPTPTVSRPPVASTAVKPAVSSRMVYADFERQQDLKPIGNLGGSTMISSFEQNPAARTLLLEGTPGGSALLLDAEGALSQRVFLDYQTFAPNEWAGASLDISALPAKNGRKQALDVSAYDTVTMELSVTGAQKLLVELRSMENGLTSGYGEYPQVELAVGSTPKTYRIALSALRPPSWAKLPLNIKDVLKRLTEISIKVVTSSALRGRLTVDNIVFERSGSSAAIPKPTAASKPVSTAKPTAVSGAQSSTLNPASLEFGVLRQVAGSRPGDLAIYYAIKNIGTRAVTISVRGLRVKQAGRDLTASLRVDLVSISLRPGQAHLGTIIVRDTKPGNLMLSWTAAELGTGRSYVLERSLQVQVILINNQP